MDITGTAGLKSAYLSHNVAQNATFSAFQSILFSINFSKHILVVKSVKAEKVR